MSADLLDLSDAVIRRLTYDRDKWLVYVSRSVEGVCTLFVTTKHPDDETGLWKMNSQDIPVRLSRSVRGLCQFLEGALSVLIEELEELEEPEVALQ
jgi:hypothetical protein